MYNLFLISTYMVSPYSIEVCLQQTCSLWRFEIIIKVTKKLK